MVKIQAELRSLKKKVCIYFYFFHFFQFSPFFPIFPIFPIFLFFDKKKFKKIDEETLKQKRDEKIKVLMQERDYFRKEAVKLDTICKDQEKKLKEAKMQNKVMNEDKAYYEAFILSFFFFFFKIAK